MGRGSVGRIVGGVVLVAVVGGCSGQGNGADAGDDTRDEAVVNPARSDRSHSPVPGSSELEANLLALDDMPDGWTDLHLSYTAVEVCLRTEMPEALGAAEYPTGAVAFAAEEGAFVPDVFEKIVAVPQGEGSAVFGSTRGSLDICGTYGGEVDGLMYLGGTELPVPAIGDETVGRRVIIEDQATQAIVGVDVLYARAGDTIVGVGVVEPEGQTERLVELATLAFDRAT
jgi:hypothetical protein